VNITELSPCRTAQFTPSAPTTISTKATQAICGAASREFKITAEAK
jgi:hypothetical protein